MKLIMFTLFGDRALLLTFNIIPEVLKSDSTGTLPAFTAKKTRARQASNGNVFAKILMQHYFFEKSAATLVKSKYVSTSRRNFSVSILSQFGPKA